MDSLHIQADDRECNSGMLSILQNHPNVILDIKRMVYGDYLVDNWLIIERNKINDLLVSIILDSVVELVGRVVANGVIGVGKKFVVTLLVKRTFFTIAKRTSGCRYFSRFNCGI